MKRLAAWACAVATPAMVAMLATLPTASAQVPAESTLRQLLDRHRWFDLRDATAGQPVPPLYAGAVAAAFNRTADAESLLRRAAGEARNPHEANEAREILAGVYLRTSRSADLVRILDDMFASAPDRADVRNMRDGFAAFRRMPNVAARLDRRPFPCAVAPDGISLPASVNGHPVRWLFDSGFSNVSTSEAEARAIGLRMLGGAIAAGDFDQTTSSRIAIADRIRIGGSELQHVPVMVFPDTNPMWQGRPSGSRGIFALPVAIALGGLRWTRTGTCEAGGASPRPSIAGANLAFDSDSPPVTRGSIGGEPFDVSLDTGAQSGTQLWQRFAADFPQLMKGGVSATIDVQEAGGRRDERVTIVPNARFRIGGFEATLAQARVFAKPGDGFRHGNLGMDVFSQADVAFDFEGMTVSLR